MQIVGYILFFCAAVFFLAEAYLFAGSTDEILHGRKTYDSYAMVTLKAGKRLFFKHESDKTDEIYLIAFVEQIVCFLLLLGAIALLIASIVTAKAIILGAMIGALVYFCIVLILHAVLKRKCNPEK